MTQPVQTAAASSSPTPAATATATSAVHTPKHTPTKKEKLQFEVKEAIELAKRGISNTEKKLVAVSQERKKFVEMFPGSMRSAVDKGTREALGKCADTIAAFANITEAFPTFQRVKELGHSQRKFFNGNAYR